MILPVVVPQSDSPQCRYSTRWTLYWVGRHVDKTEALYIRAFLPYQTRNSSICLPTLVPVPADVESLRCEAAVKITWQRQQTVQAKIQLLQFI